MRSCTAALRKADELIDQVESDKGEKLTFSDGFAYYEGKKIIPFEYRTYQKKMFELLDSGKHKKFFLHWPRRSGKDAFCFTYLLNRAIKEKGLYSYILPLKASSRKIIWDGGVHHDGHLTKFLEMIPKQLVKRKNASDMRIELINGSVIYLDGADNFDRLRGIFLSGVVFSEFAFGKSSEGFDVISPVMGQSGGFMLVNTTPNGRNFSWQKFNQFKGEDQWYCSLESCQTLLDENGDRYITEEQIQNSIADGLSPGKVKQEFYCEPMLDTDTLYFAYEMQLIEEEGRIKEHTLMRNETMYFAMDLGLDTTSIIGFQVNSAGHPIVSYYFEDKNKTWEFYWNEINRYVSRKGLPMGKLFLPHDSVKRDAANKVNAITTFKEFGANVHLLKRPASKALAKDSAIEKAKRALRFTVINRECARLIEALSSYGRDYDEKTKTYKIQPRHDWASHPSDAFQYLAMALDESLQNNVVQPYYRGN